MDKIRVFFIIILILFFSKPVIAQTVFEQYVPQKNEIIFNQSIFKIDAIDPQAVTNVRGANYPGLRGANQLIVYTPSFGYRTNTNEFGTEAVITENIVTSLSGADSLIPPNGYVISGHGRAKKWINENIKEGIKYLKRMVFCKVFLLFKLHVYKFFLFLL